MQADRDAAGRGNDEGGQHLDEGIVHAWLDGALTRAESAEVAAHAEKCDDCASMVAEARGLIAASSRILSALDDDRGNVSAAADTSVSAAFAKAVGRMSPTGGAPDGGGGSSEPSTTIDLSSHRQRRRLPDWRWRVAATVLVVAGASALVLSDGDWRSASLPQMAESVSSDSPGSARVIQPDSQALDITGSEPERVSVLSEGRSANAGTTAGEEPPQQMPDEERVVSSSEKTGAQQSLRAAEAAAGEVSRQRGTPPAPPPAAAPSEPSVAPRAMALQRMADSSGDPSDAPSRVAGFALQGKVVAASPTRVVRGQVRSVDSQPIAGATVHVPGAAAGVRTDDEGRFALPVTARDSVIVVRVLGYVPGHIALTPSIPQDSVASVVLRRDTMTLSELVVTGVAQDSTRAVARLEAWLADGAAPGDPRVVGAAGCWALVGGRVPGATEGVLLRLHPDSDGGTRSWVPLGPDSILVRLAGAAELRLEREGERMSGLSRRSGPAGTPTLQLEFARVRCG